jgi:large subunit ribosomal protein L19e
MKNLNKRKELAAKVLGVGIDRIIFDSSSLAEIKEAITKQDVRDLYSQGIIRIREKFGRKTKEKRKTKRGEGKIKVKVKNRKKKYALLTRKFRRYLFELLKQGKITGEKHLELRKRIKAGEFKDKAHIKEHIGGKI